MLLGDDDLVSANAPLAVVVPPVEPTAEERRLANLRTFIDKTKVSVGLNYDKPTYAPERTATDFLVEHGFVSPPARPPGSSTGGSGMLFMKDVADLRKQIATTTKEVAASEAAAAAAANTPYVPFTPPPRSKGTPTWLIPAGLAAAVVGYVVWKM